MVSALDTEFFQHGALGVIRLNRPQVLNALAPAQFSALHRQLTQWVEDETIGAVVVEGAGDRAFSAGGDIRAVWDNHQGGRQEASRTLFREEYALDRLIHRYPKPYVALVDGIVMGGGAGISVNGAFQVATERTVFAMPEAAIGFFPDVGATHFLSRCPGRLGLYLGLTGARLGGADMKWAGLASHTMPSTGLAALKDRLAVAAASTDPWAAVRATLDATEATLPDGGLADIAGDVDDCFAADNIEQILEKTASCPAAWAQDASRRMAAAAPISLAVILRQLGEEGQRLDFEQVMAREYRMARAFLAGHQFVEGIRAAVVDKDWRPRWSPATLAEITTDLVARHFAPVADELTFEAEGEPQ